MNSVLLLYCCSWHQDDASVGRKPQRYLLTAGLESLTRDLFSDWVCHWSALKKTQRGNGGLSYFTFQIPWNSWGVGLCADWWNIHAAMQFKPVCLFIWSRLFWAYLPKKHFNGTSTQWCEMTEYEHRRIAGQLAQLNVGHMAKQVCEKLKKF